MNVDILYVSQNDTCNLSNTMHYLMPWNPTLGWNITLLSATCRLLCYVAFRSAGLSHAMSHTKALNNVTLIWLALHDVTV